MENLLIAVNALGLGACWLGYHPRPERVAAGREILELPDHVEILGIASIGYPSETKPPGDRYQPEWVHQDLYDSRCESHSPWSTVYICSEVLEHLADDRAVVSAVPTGHRLILSVPNFHDHAHVRVFADFNDIRERYGDLLDFRRWVIVNQRVHVCEAQRR